MKKKSGMEKFLARVKKQKALGIIYNIPNVDAALLVNRLLDEKKHIVINARDAYTSAMLKYRLGSKLKVKGLSFNMLPELLQGKIITVNNADMIKESYARVFDDFRRYGVPLLLLMHSDSAMKDLRKWPSYTRVMTIEADFKLLN
ncbi:hypothetical protein ACSSWA_01470 [Melioribacter sp. Ez-97]|uniref:hypothetical protein n=1 Tax=Melioribacter sp. Ez-97 TaxID=3423434 RepID=UPI003ED8E88A